MKELILGGARSGKSALAVSHAQESRLPVFFIATATAGDEEMAARIAYHRANRPKEWRLIEEPLGVVDVLQRHAKPGHCLLVDCLTLWLSNLLTMNDAVGRNGNDGYQAEIDRLLDCLPTLDGHVILVSNELGQGVVPIGAPNRKFVDEAGRLHQGLARVCDRVTLTVAGLPITIKETGQ